MLPPECGHQQAKLTNIYAVVQTPLLACRDFPGHHLSMQADIVTHGMVAVPDVFGSC